MGDRVSRLSDTRLRLAAAIRADGVLPEWRVHDYPPDTIASPCVWVDVPAVRVDDLSRGAKQIVSTWSIIFVFDGGDEAQVRGLDEGMPRVWDAIDALDFTDATAANAQPFDVGGPRTRGVVITCDVSHMTRSFCKPLPKLAATASP